MGSRSLGELLLRPSLFIRTPLCQIARTRRMPPPSSRRSITSTPNQPAAQPQRKEDDFDYEPEARQSEAQQPPSRSTPPRFPSARTATSSEASQDIDSLIAGLPRSQPPVSRQQHNSSDELRTARAKHVFGSEFSSATSRLRSRTPPKLRFDDMDLPEELLDPNLSNKPSEAAALATQQEETFANYPRLNPTYGKAVELDPSRGRDIVRGISMLGSLCARNAVKKEFNKQKFHERGGLKRKRLASERWRARFKKGFGHITARVSELTRKGW